MAMEGKRKYRIVKLTENRFMVQKLGMRITPTSYGNLVLSRANELKEPVDYETAMAYIEQHKKPLEEQEVVYEIEI